MKSSVVSAWSDGDNYLLCIFYGLRFYNMGLCNFFLFFFVRVMLWHCFLMQCLNSAGRIDSSVLVVHTFHLNIPFLFDVLKALKLA
jgi:hypothetical protein